MSTHPTAGENNDFLLGADTKAKEKFTAADVLLYLFSDCVKWTEDVDGDARDDGTPYAIVNHDIRLSDYHLSELMDMAGIGPGRMMETTLERLKRASDAALNAK